MSAGGCLRAGMSLRQHIVVRCFIYNKILKAETTAAVVFSRLGFPPKILVFICDALCDALFYSYCTCLLFIEYLMNE